MLISKTLRKKGGIFIKKINIFLILIASIFISKNIVINVQAEDANFYEAEYIDGIYMNKYDYSTGITYFQKARFFRKTNTNEFAYCIEPFKIFNESSTYESTISPTNLNKNQIDRISKIAHFGYGYSNHNDSKWYAITQMMIWKEANPNNGDYYFTDSLNGNRINPYDNEINEINNLINNHNTIPSFSNKTYTIISNNKLILEDTNNVLDKYIIDNNNNNNYEIKDNKIIINNLKKGNYKYNLIKQDNYYNKPYIFYQANNSQNLIKTGDIENISTSFQINVVETEIDVFKIDKDTKSIITKGEAKLDGSTFTLYDSNMNKIKDLVIKNNQSIIKNINFGKYYLKETTPGIGYLLNDKIYEINITEKNTHQEIIVENKVIEKKITIEKKYGDNYILKNEKNISFDIYNYLDEKINTITTNEEGIAEITLPYGEYKIVQINSTEGYQKIDPITIKIDNTENEKIELKDMKIPVPNTHTDNTLLLEIIKLLLILW